MNYFKELIDTVVNLMKIEFTLWGFNLSLWSIFIYGILATLVVWTIVKIFKGGD